MIGRYQHYTESTGKSQTSLVITKFDISIYIACRYFFAKFCLFVM